MARSLTHYIQKGKICKVIGTHSHTFLTPGRLPIFLRAKPQTILPFKWNNTVGDSTSHTGAIIWRRDSNGAALYEVYNMFSRYHDIPVAVFEYGAAGVLGNISLIGPGGSLRTQTIAAFLVEVGGPRHRKFIASDGHEYSWSWRTSTDEDIEWSCVNASGLTVAWYAVSSSGRMFGVEEPYPHLAIEFLTTLMIMRHIAARNT